MRTAVCGFSFRFSVFAISIPPAGLRLKDPRAGVVASSRLVRRDLFLQLGKVFEKSGV